MNLVWHDLTPPWQSCIEEAWIAYCMGSLPIGTALTDASGKVVATQVATDVSD
jgi:hypothetical protein